MGCKSKSKQKSNEEEKKENYLVRLNIPAYSAKHYFNGSGLRDPNIIAAIGKDITYMKSTQCKNGHGTGLLTVIIKPISK
jgi:hypothetical protein